MSGLGKMWSDSSGSKQKQPPSLIQDVETMASAMELISETLADLNDEQFKKFKELVKVLNLYQFNRISLYRYPPNSNDQLIVPLDIADKEDMLFLMVSMHGQQIIERTKDILKEIKRPDLVQRLSHSSLGPKEKHSHKDGRLSALFRKVATMMAVKELLLKTLRDLSSEEIRNFKWLLQFRLFQRSLPHISWRGLQPRQELVNVMVDICGQQSVEVTKEVCMDLNRTDLAHWLPEVSSGPTEEHSLDEHWPGLIQKVETMVLILELLSETLDLSVFHLKNALLIYTDLNERFQNIPKFLLNAITSQDVVFLLVQIYGQRSVEVIKEVLKKQQRTGLLQKLSDSSSGPKKKQSAEKRCSTLILRVATMAAVKQLLLETLNDLGNEELKRFKELLQSIVSHKDLREAVSSCVSDRAKIVDLMLQTYGQQSVGLIREVFMEMRRNDLVQRLAISSSGTKGKHSENTPVPFEGLAGKGAVKKILLETLNDLSYWELNKFKWLLQVTYFQNSLPQISWALLDGAERPDQLVDLMVENKQSVKVTKEVFMDMNRMDLAERLSQTISQSKGPSTSRESCVGGSMMYAVEPEVSCTDATYRLQSEAGRFECSVSGLRWVCKEKVCFKYQFCSWEEHLERIEGIKYMPAGPLIDITVISGKLDEVYLPHWICLDDNPKISDRFAALHIDDCGDVVEKVSEVTSSHVKLSKPIFSPRAALMKVGFPVKINCRVLIYKTNTAFLTLHVYLIPSDPGLEQAMDKKKLSHGYDVIQKPYPETPLKMHDRFILTSDLHGAEIYPQKLKLRYESRDPNFFEVFIENPGRNFILKLTKENETQPVWMCAIRKDEYQRNTTGGQKQAEHFVDRHWCDLINRVSNIGPILDHLLTKDVIQQEVYCRILAFPTTQERMRYLQSGPLKAGGRAAKDIFYTILEKEEPYLVRDLKRKES